MKRYLLIDCNNFFVSCERVFNPKLLNKPVVVLSSNDACVIARSNEAKALGIPMGESAFRCERIFKKHNVIVFSSNFTLYGDMSARIMQVLAQLSINIEIYSVDEAFIFISEYTSDKSFNDVYYREYAKYIRQTVKQQTGIPISIGIGPTKTLAKIANKIAKKNELLEGVYDITAANNIDEILATYDISDVWGIGSRYSKLLRNQGIKTALDFKGMDTRWVKKNLTIVGLKTLLEIRGMPCLSLNEIQKPRQSICVSRSFGRNVTSLLEVKEALASYICKAAEKLRAQNTIANVITVFLLSNKYHDQQYYYNSKTAAIPLTTAYTPDLIKIGHKCVESIYVQGYQYKKVGVLFSDLVNFDFQQLDIYNIDQNKDKKNKIIKAIDKINFKFGGNKVFFASMGIKRDWKNKQLKKSSCYTTNWNEILTITLTSP